VNGKARVALEAHLADFFCGDTALLFNSGFDANVGFFSCVPQSGDVIVYDEYIHASVHDGIRSSRAKDAQFSFGHNSMSELRRLLFRLRDERVGLRTGESSLFLSVESLSSMDGTSAPLREIADLLDEVFPLKNSYLVVDEAHATGIYGPQGRGCVALLGLEDRVLVRLYTFGKALAATGGAFLQPVFSAFSH
jgi:8-amino-7-oxononanoate synthase